MERRLRIANFVDKHRQNMKKGIVNIALAMAAIAMTHCAPGPQGPGSAHFDNFELRWVDHQNEAITDSFNTNTLSPLWGYNKETDDSLISTSARPGWLSLRDATDPTTGERRGARVTTSVTNLLFDSRVKMSLAMTDTTERAGIAVMRDREHQYKICAGPSVDGRTSVDVIKVSDGNTHGTRVAQEIITCDSLELRILSPNGRNMVFCYAPDGNAWVALSEDMPLSYLTGDYLGRDPQISLFIE